MWIMKTIIVAVIITIASTKALLSSKVHNKQPYANTETYLQCPGMYERVFTDSTPKANTSSNIYTAYNTNSHPVTLQECVLACCFLEKTNAQQEECNVALLTNTGRCYHVACSTSELCLPQSQNDDVQMNMVLVRPVNPNGPSWADMLVQSKQGFRDAFDSLWRISDSQEMDRSDGDVQMSNRLLYNNDALNLNTEPPETVTDGVKIHLHVLVDSKQVQLPDNNVTLEAHVLNSTLEPKQYQYEWITLQQPDAPSAGAIRNQQDNRLILSHLSQGRYLFNLTATDGKSSSGWTLANVTVLGAVRINAPPTIVITPANQTVRLPNQVAILDASATTDDADDADKLRYHWELQQGPLGYEPSLPGAATLQLSDLANAGEYVFQLSAQDADGAQAKALAFITVLPPIDYPPTADAGADQVLYLPLSDGDLVLSGNGSTDDHEIVSWEWTRVNNAHDTNTNTSAVNTDTNMQAVDMRDTRTPTLHLGRVVEAGVYTFQLRVGDASNQTSTAQVRLFVKEKEGQQKDTLRPLAVIAGNASVLMAVGQTWLTLDGRNSTVVGYDGADLVIQGRMLTYRWDLVGNSTGTVGITNPRASVTNVTGLSMAGVYQIQLHVTLNTTNNTTDSAIVNITVAQTVPPAQLNLPPHAVATIADSTVQLPRNVIYVNASQSTDADGAIVSYVWRTCDDANGTAAGLGAGAVAEGTDRHPVLVLVLAGVVLEVRVHACWNVTVCDAGALCDWQAVRFSVAPDDMLPYMVEVVVGGGSTSPTIAQYNHLLQTIESSLDTSTSTSSSLHRHPIQIHVRPTVGGTTTPGYTLITLYATTTTATPSNSSDASTIVTLTAARLADILLGALPTPLAQLQLHLITVRPASCVSVACSGHGRCDPVTRTCHCQPLWMRNVFGRAGDDCSWSVLYVTLACAAVVSVAVCVVYTVWRVLCGGGGGDGRISGGRAVMVQTQQKQRHRRKVRNSHSYTLIDNALVDRKRQQRHLDSDSDDPADSADSDRDDNVVFSSLKDKL